MSPRFHLFFCTVPRFLGVEGVLDVVENGMLLLVVVVVVVLPPLLPSLE
jgi:hypothetical protein